MQWQLAEQALRARADGQGIRPGKPQTRPRRAGLLPGRDPRPHARASVRELVAAWHLRQQVHQVVPLLAHRAHASSAGPAAPMADTRNATAGCLFCQLLTSQAGSSHPPVPYRVARLLDSPSQAAQDAKRRRQGHHYAADPRARLSRRRGGDTRRAAVPRPACAAARGRCAARQQSHSPRPACPQPASILLGEEAR